MNGWSNASTWIVASMIDNNEELYNAVQQALREQGEDIAIFHRAEDDGEFQDFFVPKLAKTVETVVRDWYLNDVNWAELAIAMSKELENE